MTVSWHVVEKLLIVSRMSKVTIKIKYNQVCFTEPLKSPVGEIYGHGFAIHPFSL